MRGGAVVARRAHNPKVVSSNLAPATKQPHRNVGLFIGIYFLSMYTVYVLYSIKFDKIYIGYTSNLKQRILSHNYLGKKGYTIRYRPWTVVHIEQFQTKSEAMKREKHLKSGQGRQFIRDYYI